MQYQISRNGQMYGPYTLDDLRRYLASGNVLPTDLAKSEEMSEWLPVAQILERAEAASPVAAVEAGPVAQASGVVQSGSPASSYRGPDFGGQVYGATPTAGFNPQAGAMAASAYPDAPNLHWGLVLLFAFLTCTLFMWVWNLIVAAWLKRVQPNATSLFYYAGAAALTVVQIMVGVPYGMHHAFTPGMHYHSGNPVTAMIGILVWVIRLIARFSQRASLEEHFNGPEPMGLQLSPVMTFFFGGLYFQAKLNEINAMKLAARYGSVRPY